MFCIYDSIRVRYLTECNNGPLTSIFFSLSCEWCEIYKCNTQRYPLNIKLIWIWLHPHVHVIFIGVCVVVSVFKIHFIVLIIVIIFTLVLNDTKKVQCQHDLWLIDKAESRRKANGVTFRTSQDGRIFIVQGTGLFSWKPLCFSAGCGNYDYSLSCFRQICSN